MRQSQAAQQNTQGYVVDSGHLFVTPAARTSTVSVSSKPRPEDQEVLKVKESTYVISPVGRPADDVGLPDVSLGCELHSLLGHVNLNCKRSPERDSERKL